MSIRLVSWNVHGLPWPLARPGRLARWAGELIGHAPAVAMLQELWLQRDVAALDRCLPRDRYRRVGVPATGPVRRGGLLTLVDTAATGWRIAQQAFEPFAASAPAWRLWEADGIMGKGFHRVRLDGDGGPLTIVNAHLQAEYTPALPRERYTRIRRSQLEQLTRAAAAAVREGPVLVAGDFNTTPDEAALQQVLTDAGWIDLTAALRREDGGGTALRHDEEPPEWLDYMFAVLPEGMSVTSQASLIRSTAPDVPFSDHHGLVVDVSLSTAAW